VYPFIAIRQLEIGARHQVNMHPSWMQMMRPFVSAHLLALVINVGNSANGNTACRLHLDEPTDLQIGGGISEWMGKLRGIQDSFKVPRTPLSSHPPLATWGRLKPRSFGRLVNLAISGHCGWQRRMQENRKTGSRLRQSVSTPVHWPSAASMAPATSYSSIPPQQVSNWRLPFKVYYWQLHDFIHWNKLLSLTQHSKMCFDCSDLWCENRTPHFKIQFPCFPVYVL